MLNNSDKTIDEILTSIYQLEEFNETDSHSV